MPSPVRDKSSRKVAVEATPVGCSSQKLRSLTRRVSQHFDHQIVEAGLKTTQFTLLTCVAHLGPSRPGDLAAALHMDASTLTRNLQPLVAQGLLQVGPGDDGRTRLVSITDVGRERRTEAKRSWKRAQTAFNDRVGAERVARLHALIDECMAALDATPAD